MSGVGEAGLVLGIISSIISIIDATKEIWEAVNDESGLPANFRKSAAKLPLITKLLEDAERYIQNTIDESVHSAFTPTLEDCKAQAALLQELFAKVIPEEGDSRLDRYVKAARTIGKGGRVETLIRAILDDLQLLATTFPDTTNERGKEQLAKAIEEVTRMEPSLADGFEEALPFAHYGSGAQNVNTGGGSQYNNNSTGNQNNGPGQQYIGTNYIAFNAEDIDRLCLRSLRCPDTLRIKVRLKQTKDKLLHESTDWILTNEQFVRWKNGDNVSLLWIKGGAGKGKTMMSIRLIEWLSYAHDGGESPLVTYFFCQNSDHELNTLEAIMKGLILRLVKQQNVLMEPLRCRWDTAKGQFIEDLSSWQILWYILMDILDRCKGQKVYIIVDAIDECRSNGMADFLKLLVRTGLSAPSQVKWLLTGRPMDSAGRELLSGYDQLLLSLELNSQHISEAVKTYIASKTDELDRRWSYGNILRQSVEAELLKKSEGTYLWVSLVCQALEGVSREKALIVIRDAPLGLYPLYDRALRQVFQGERALVGGCMRLLKVMMLAYRPLSMAEIGSVAGLSGEETVAEALVDRCASFVRRRGQYVEFVHQSARDYLSGKAGESMLDHYGLYGHGEIALACLSHLIQRLRVNLVDLPRTYLTREFMTRSPLIDSVEYAATFWTQHLNSATQTTLIQAALTERGEVDVFLRARLLEWLECLSLLGKLPDAVQALKILQAAVELTQNTLLSAFVEDATRFLLRHYHTIVNWPLQIYSSAMALSPQSSIVRRSNLDKLPAWLKRLPEVEHLSFSLIQTLTGHRTFVEAVIFSPDGKQLVSGACGKSGFKIWDPVTGDLLPTPIDGSLDWPIIFSSDGKQVASTSQRRTIKLWDAQTGHLQEIQQGHSERVTAMAFSPDGKQLVSGSGDKTMSFWDTHTGQLQGTIVDSALVNAIALSPAGKQMASGLQDATIKLWDTQTGHLQKTLSGHAHSVTVLAFSTDGKLIASGSTDTTVKVWDTQTGDLQKTLEGHENTIHTVAFSPDGKRVASAGRDKLIHLWNIQRGCLEKKLVGHTRVVNSIAFSPDGKRLVSGSDDKTIKVWDTRIGDVKKTPATPNSVTAIAFSLDGSQVVSGSMDRTIKVWDTRTGELQKTLAGSEGWIADVSFSPNSKRIVSATYKTVNLWDTQTGNLQKSLTGHLDRVTATKFSPDNQKVASGSEDRIIIWDCQTGKVKKTLMGHSVRIKLLEFTADGKQIIAATGHGEIKVWDVDGDVGVPRLHYFENIGRDAEYSIRDSVLRKVAVMEHRKVESKPERPLYVRNEWIHYGEMPLLFLPSDFEPECEDSRGDKLAIGFGDGQVVIFDFDRTSLEAISTPSA